MNTTDFEVFSNDIALPELDIDLPAIGDVMNFAGEAFDLELPTIAFDEFNPTLPDTDPGGGFQEMDLPDFDIDLPDFDVDLSDNAATDLEQYTFQLHDFTERFRGECVLEAEHETRQGRPCAITSGKRIMLGYAFTLDGSVSEACEFAGISRNTYYRYLKQHPAFSMTVERFKVFPVLRARLAIERAIDAGDTKTVQWYLERKRPQEFATSKARGNGHRNSTRRGTGRIYAKTIRRLLDTKHHAA